MSLINDALNRAKQAQETKPQPPGTGLHFRPVEPTQRDSAGSSRMLPTLLVAALVASVFLLREINRENRRPGWSQVRTWPAITPPVLPVRAAAVSRPAPAASKTAAASVPAATAEAPPPKPPPLRLQAVFYNPARPSAIISGDTVYVGDRVRAFCVTQIRSNSATLVGATGTNVLSLE
jgi:hypothetical protein